MKPIKLSIFVFFLIAISTQGFAQQDRIKNKIELNYYYPVEYEIGGIRISGADHLDHPSIILLSGLSVGERIYIPSERITSAIDKLWKQGIFDDIQFNIDKIEGKTIMLNLHLATKPRLSNFNNRIFFLAVNNLRASSS